MPTSETTGFAILGPGIVADDHRQAIAANADLGARLVAVGHHNPARFAEISATFGVPCLSQEDLLAHPAVDVVCICTPSGQHAAQTIAAAQAGKHVLVEKPMALSLADADAMIAACAQAGVKLGVVFQRRAKNLFRRIHDAIQAGDLGDLTMGVVTIPYYRSQAYYEQADWRGTWALDGGGVLMNQGIHLVDVLVWTMGDPVQVRAYASTLCRDIEVEDTLAATLRFANGALVTITATTTAVPGFPPRIEIYGTAGCIQVEGESVRRWELVDPQNAPTEGPETTGIPANAGAGGVPSGIAPIGHAAVFRDFVEALHADRPPRVDGAEGRRSLATVLAIYRAAGVLS
jgi:UDP-N-acetyl-2-amino-2-deoxyglucuronate dehydrogenase